MQTQERIFPKHVKLLLLSQSDFSLPGPMPVALGMFLIRVLGAIVVGSSQSFVGWNWFLRKHGIHHHHASQDSFFPDSSQKPISNFTSSFQDIFVYMHDFTEFNWFYSILSCLLFLKAQRSQNPKLCFGRPPEKNGGEKTRPCRRSTTSHFQAPTKTWHRRSKKL